MISILSISVGATLGALIRWLLSLWLNTLFTGFAFGTFIANSLGCFLMGLAMGALLYFPQINSEWRLFFITGFLGSLTTFSAFSAEIMENIMQDKWMMGLGIMSIHLIAGLICMSIGIWLWKLV